MTTGEIVKDLGLVTLGALLALVSQWIFEKWKLRNQKIAAFNRLDRLVSEVANSVGHGHDFTNKADWQRELDELAMADREWLGDLYEPVKKISWQIRDHTFEHSEKDSTNYCCDELLLDLYFLQLVILPLIPLPRKQADGRARKLGEQIIINTWGVVGGDDIFQKQVDEFLKKWKAGTLKLGDEFAVAIAWNKEKEQ